MSARISFAQEATIGYQGLPYKASGESQTGINVAEGMLLHVGAGVEAGYDSNVFYGNSDSVLTDGKMGTASSAVIRTTSYAELTNTTRATGVPSAMSFDLRAGLTYRRYVDPSDPDVSKYSNAFMPTAGLALGYGTGRLAFQLTDSFLRLEDAPYQNAASQPLTRDNNMAAAEMRYSPGGGRISTVARYTNAIDIFESSDFSYASTVVHTLLVDVSWKWLPKTAIFFDATQGYVTYLHSGEANDKKKFDSYPLHLVVGLRGLVTPKLSVNASLGYGNSFEASGGLATTGGFWGSTYVDVSASYNPTLLSRLTAGYHHDFANSVISSFYYEDSIYGSYVQQIAGRLAFDLSARLSRRNYQGLLFGVAPTTRIDDGVNVGATLDYFVRAWIYGGVGYSLLANISDYKTPDGHGVDYTKHQVFARLGLTY